MRLGHSAKLLLLIGPLLAGCTQTRALYEYATGKTPGLYARKLLDRNPDERWQAVNFLASHDYGLKPPYTDEYRLLAVGVPAANLKPDPDYVVRALAVRALNRARDGRSTGAFIVALSDESDLVRLEACKALVNVPDAKAIPLLGQLASSTTENRDVRIAATAALRQYRDLAAARTLVTLLDAREFGLAWQARQSLRDMTGQDHAYDQGAWLAYLAGPGKPLG